MEKDEKFMRLALAEAQKALGREEVPVGAVIVLDGRVIARAHNRPVSLNDPCAHAEILALKKAAKKIGNYRLTGAEMYVTLEPCVMCSGAILNARIKRIVFGAKDLKSGAVVSLFRMLEDKRLNHSVEVAHGVMEEACSEILSRFFREKRILFSARKKTKSGEVPKWS
jgi:tRNA(adenine34) deaminase